MGKLITILTFINCPVVKKRTCRFAIDNNFFPSTYWTARYKLEKIKKHGSNFTILPCSLISRGEKILSIAKRQVFFFDHRTVYESKNCNQFPHSTDFIFIKIT